MSDSLERRAVISGIGQSDVGRRLGRSALSLTVGACLSAIDDAGLTRADIDGLATFPGDMDGLFPDLGPGTRALQDALRLNLNWHAGVCEGPAQISAVMNACMAVACGLARHVLVYRTVVMFGGSLTNFFLNPDGVDGPHQFWMPFGATGGPQLLAPFARRHMHEFGTTREQLGAIALNGRRNAGLNPRAIYRDPLTMEQYLDAPMVSDPFCLLDCDAPVDGSTAFIVSTSDFAKDCRNRAVQFEALGSASCQRVAFDQWDLRNLSSRAAADQMWSRTSLRPQDVDIAELYDGFSFLAINWLEDLGFCAKGEGGALVEGGKYIALDGELPLNTDGGQLSAGRLHGYGLLREACVQLRGEAGDRQIEGAEVAVVSNGSGQIAGCMLVSRHH